MFSHCKLRFGGVTAKFCVCCQERLEEARSVGDTNHSPPRTGSPRLAQPCQRTRSLGAPPAPGLCITKPAGHPASPEAPELPYGRN